MSRDGDWRDAALQWRRNLLAVGAVAIAVSLLGAYFDTGRFFQSYLLAFTWTLGIGLGCLPLLMLHHLVGGWWGFVVRRCLESATRTIPLLALLFAPVLAGMSEIYVWTDSERVAADYVLEHKSPYLNTVFFIVRALLYFGVWMVWAHYLNRWSIEQDGTGDPAILRKLQLLSAAGILLYGLTITFASVDWIMSLEPHWYSTIFGMLIIAGQALSALAFAVIVIVALSKKGAFGGRIAAGHLHDLGNLILAFVLLWAYFSFSQYLIIWSGNLPDEIGFYVHRMGAGWQWLSAFLILFHFGLPFIVLLSRRTKRSAQTLARVAAALLLARWVDLYWTILPSFGVGARPHWMDLTLSAGLASLWLWAFLGQLAARPLLPAHEPRLDTRGALTESRA